MSESVFLSTAETWTQVVTGILDIVFVVVKGYCLQYFLGSFLEKRFPKNRWNGFWFLLLFGLLWEGVRWMLPPADFADVNYESLRVILQSMAAFAAILAVSLIFYQIRAGMTIYLAVSFFAVGEITFLGIYTLWSRAVNLVIDWECRCFEKGNFSADTFMVLTYLTNYAALFLLYLLSAFVLYVVLKNIVLNFREKNYGIQKTELLFLLTPELTGLFICIMLRILMFVVENEMPVFLYDKYPLLVLIVPAVMLFSLLSVLYGVRTFQDVIDKNREKSSRVILENQISNMQSHIEEIEHVYSGVRSMKHDMKNTLALVWQLAAGGRADEDEKLQEYVDGLNKSFEKLEFRFQTGNSVVDTLLHMKHHEINRILPDLHLQIEADKLLFADDLQIQSYDISVILGNALDNAIEACEKLYERQAGKETDTDFFIRLASFRKGQMFFLEIENSYDGTLIWKAGEEFPQTDKAQKESHGIGLSNIRQAAEKYHGAVDWSADGRRFVLSVMMKNEKGMG